MGHRFLEGKIEGEKEFGGNVFPKTLKPPSEMNNDGVDELVEMVKEEREWLNKTLEAHSAILFKGFGVKSAEEFDRVVEAFGWENMTYSAPAPKPILRHLVAGRVYTSNATPVTQLITFHHEMAWVREVPSKIFFYCAQPSPEGGETSILCSQVVVDQMKEKESDFVSKVSTTGIVHRISLQMEYDSKDAEVVNAPWNWILDNKDLAEAQKRAKEKLLCSEVKFREDGIGELVFGPTNPIRSYGGKRVWFNTIVCYAPKDSDSITFTDGTKLSESAVETFKQILEENCVNIKWEKGDFLLVDNLMAQHARRPGKPPRQILVSICKLKMPDKVQNKHDIERKVMHAWLQSTKGSTFLPQSTKAFSFNHAFQKANFAANDLANIGHQEEVARSWTQSLPRSIRNAIELI